VRNSVVITNIVCLRVVLPSAQALLHLFSLFCSYCFHIILEVNIFISTVVHVPNVMNKLFLYLCVSMLSHLTLASSFILRVLNPTGSREDRD
jgi:hypothetical protein